MCILSIPAFKRQRQADFCEFEFEARLVYIENSNTAKARDPASK